MERRRFLGGLLAAIAAPAALLEAAKRTPRNPTWMGVQRATYAKFSETDIVARELERVRDKIPLLFEREDAFYAAITRGDKVHLTSRRNVRVNLVARPGRHSDFDLGRS